LTAVLSREGAARESGLILLRSEVLTVQAPVKFDLVVNLRAAKVLGLTVPPMLISLANEVIE
jgi:hypothetical protein